MDHHGLDGLGNAWPILKLHSVYMSTYILYEFVILMNDRMWEKAYSYFRCVIELCSFGKAPNTIPPNNIQTNSS